MKNIKSNVYNIKYWDIPAITNDISIINTPQLFHKKNSLFMLIRKILISFSIIIYSQINQFHSLKNIKKNTYKLSFSVFYLFYTKSFVACKNISLLDLYFRFKSSLIFRLYCLNKLTDPYFWKLFCNIEFVIVKF